MIDPEILSQHRKFPLKTPCSFIDLFFGIFVNLIITDIDLNINKSETEENTILLNHQHEENGGCWSKFSYADCLSLC